MLKIHIERFYANNDELTFDDVITKMRAGIAENGDMWLHIDTKAKYVRIGHCTTICAEYTGETVNISPVIYDENGHDLYETDIDAYLEHPDYYRIALVLERPDDSDGSYVERAVALKYAYMIRFIRSENFYVWENQDAGEDFELIEWVD